MPIELKSDIRQTLVESIQRFFSEDMDEEVGDLKANLVLNFCLREIGPSIYNQAISDAQTQMYAKIEDLEGSCWEPEFAYWKVKR